MKLLKSLARLVDVVVSMIVHGYTLATLWGWFVATTFAAPAISIPAAIGLRMIVRYVTFKVPARHLEAKENEHNKLDDCNIHVYSAAYNYMLCGMTLLIGFIVKKYFM